MQNWKIETEAAVPVGSATVAGSSGRSGAPEDFAPGSTSEKRLALQKAGYWYSVE